MPEFSLDNLKKTWQEQSVKNQYDQDAIVKMLNQKSRNQVKYIFWISVAEFLFFLFLTVIYIFNSHESNSFLNILEKLGVDITEKVISNFENLSMIMKGISLLVTAFFVFKFYQNFRKIHVESNLKKFILQIIRFKKTVNAFILTNIILFVVFIITHIIFVIHILKQQNIEMDNPKLTGFSLGLLISVSLCVFLVWLYYRIVYGIIMKKLSKNLAQLEEIEQENKE